MIPNANLNPSFANLAALRGIGGMPHPIRPGPTPMPAPVGPARFMPGPAPITAPANPYAMPGPQMPGTQQMAPAAMRPTGGLNQMSNLPMQPMQAPGNVGNLQALTQLFGRGGFR